jgi:hypothetical protein
MELRVGRSTTPTNGVGDGGLLGGGNRSSLCFSASSTSKQQHSVKLADALLMTLRTHGVGRRIVFNLAVFTESLFMCVPESGLIRVKFQGLRWEALPGWHFYC